ARAGKGGTRERDRVHGAAGEAVEATSAGGLRAVDRDVLVVERHRGDDRLPLTRPPERDDVDELDRDLGGGADVLAEGREHVREMLIRESMALKDCYHERAG